jgi:predicted DNA-binding protein
MNEKARLTLDLEPELHTKLKTLAARKGKTMRELCIRAIERELEEERRPYLTAAEAPLLAELWDNEEDAAYDDL